MRYIKKYNESIDNSVKWDDWDEEEEYENELSILQPGDVLEVNSIEYWSSNQWEKTDGIYTLSVESVIMSKDAVKNPHDDFMNFFKKPPDGFILFSVERHWPWFKFDEKTMIILK